MADLNAYWKQVTDSESFQDLEPEQKEKVRSHLFDKYVLSSNSYVNLPQSKRLAVKKHFDEVTAIQPDSFGQEVTKAGKKIMAKVKPAVDTVGKAISMLPAAEEAIEPAPMRMAYKKLGQGADALRGGAEALGEKIEPSEKEMIAHAQKAGDISTFDKARLYASGAIKTGGEFLAQAVPTNLIQTAAYPLLDKVFEMAGSTFLGRPISELWKPKTGLSAAETGFGDQFEKAVTKRRIENNARKMADGPPRPLEHVARAEQTAKAQAEYGQYQQWLDEAEKRAVAQGKPSPSATAEPTEDIYPDAKTNVSQLRDAAQDRLQKLKDEPVHTESLTNAEDDLKGYYRRRIDQAKVYLMSEGPRTEPQGLLPNTKTPGFPLLEEGKPNIPEPLPAPEKAPITPAPEAAPRRPAPARAPAPESPIPGMKAKDVVFKMYSAYHPGQSKQALEIRTGAFLNGLKDYGVKPNEPLTAENLNWVQKFMENEHADYLASQVPKPRKAPTVASPTAEIARLREKGLDPLEVRAEAERLAKEAELDRSTSLEKEKRLFEVTGKIAPHDPDPATGTVPELEEWRTNIPARMRSGSGMKPDQAAQMAYDAGIIPGPSSNDLYAYTRTFTDWERPHSANTFMDEAERNVEHQMHVDAGFKQPDPNLIPENKNLEMGEGAAAPAEPVEGTPPQTIIPGTEAQFPDKPVDNPLRSVKDAPTFDLLSDFFKNQGKTGGGFSGEPLDPVKKAAQEAIINELVDRAMSLGYETTQDIMLYAARNAPAELQGMLRKNLHPTLSAFDTHAYKEMEAAKQGNPVAKKGLMDAAQRNYFQKKLDMMKSGYKRFDANQQIALFKDGDEAKMVLQDQLFIHDNFRKFSKDEAAAYRWYSQDKSPKLESLKALGVEEGQAQRWLDLAKNPTEQMKSARKMTQIWSDEAYDLVSQYYDEMGYVNDHVTQRWERPEEYLDWEGKKLGNNPNFSKGRVFVTQADGVDAMHKPKSFDIRDDLKAESRMRVNIMGRIHAYQKLGASMGPDGMPAMMNEAADELTQARNAKLTPHSGQAPKSWLRFPETPLLRGVAINPYYKEVVQYMMARPFKGAAVEVIDFAAASTKAAKLMGIFHGYSQGEVTLAGINYRNVFSFNKDRNTMIRGLRYLAKAATADMEGREFSRNPFKAIGELYKSYMNGYGALANRPLALDMVENNFKISAVDDNVHNIISRTLLKLEKGLTEKIGAKVAKGITVLPRTANDILSKTIFDYQRTIGSMLVYEDNLADSIKRFNLDAPEGKKIPIEEIKKQIASQTSKAEGGLSYAQFMAHPKTQQMFQWLMLAPQWTLSRPMMATKMFPVEATLAGASEGYEAKGILGGFSGGVKAFARGTPESRMARKQMIRLFTGWYLVSNYINYKNTQKYLGKGRFIWDNPEGWRDQAFRRKDKNGTSYYQISKAMTEIADDVMHPIKTAVNKASIPIQDLVKVMNWGHSSAFYSNPYARPESPGKILKESYNPMFLSGQSAYGGLPLHKGPSKNYVEGMLNQFYDGGMKDARLYRRAMQIGLEQGYDISKLESIVKSARTREKNRAMFK